jgi:signal transduction histidine kinase
MTRRFAEWLLVPLFLLPLLGVGWFCLDQRQRYLDEIAPFFEDGAGEAAAWLERDPPRELRLSRFFAPGAPSLGPAENQIPFALPEGSGVVLLDEHALGVEPWTFSAEYPVGLSAESLADPGVRIEVETGTAPAAAAPMDAGTTALIALGPAPDLDLLRAAPLPAMTKLFLVRQWRESDLESAPLLDAERLLTALAELQRTVVLRGLPEVPGEHLMGDVAVIVPGPGDPVVIFPAGVAGGASWDWQSKGTDRVQAVLSLTLPTASTISEPLVAWRGRLELPVAGEWTISLPYGHDWWRTPRFTGLAGPVFAAVLLFLTLPSALFFTLRRRRMLDEARARFITELAHDLRTPLTSLRLYAEMLAEGKAPEERRESYIEVMARESARVSGLLANLLDLSRLERGRRDIKVERLDLDLALEPAIRDFVMLYPDREEDLAVNGDDDVSPLGDPTALGRCILNLLDNAGKFTAAGTPICISWRESDGGRVILSVQDEGPGIPGRERAGLFKRYVRGKKAKVDGVPGTGLGLSLVAELARAMGGRARYRAKDRGASFEIELPGGGL